MLLANAGLPMIVWQLPAMLMALPAVIAIEMLVARFRYQVAFRLNLKGVSLSNLASTLIGIPLAWFTMLALNILTTGIGAAGWNTPMGVFQSVVLQSSWLVTNQEQLAWMLPSATLVLLVPYFFASVYSERIVLGFIWKDLPRETVHSFTWIGNLLTYSCFFVYTCFLLLIAANTGEILIPIIHFSGSKLF